MIAGTLVVVVLLFLMEMGGRGHRSQSSPSKMAWPVRPGSRNGAPGEVILHAPSHPSHSGQEMHSAHAVVSAHDATSTLRTTVLLPSCARTGRQRIPESEGRKSRTLFSAFLNLLGS